MWPWRLRSDMSGNFRASGSRLLLWVLLVSGLGVSEGTYGQLISPGKLSRAHQNLEGIANCTRCHQFGRKGISQEKCLDCHTPLGTRIREGKGYHARVSGRTCAECHKDHFGRSFELIRFDTLRFDHAGGAGFELEGAHERLACRTCHRPDRISAADVRAYRASQPSPGKTFLGLDARCQVCHGADEVHGEQFGRRACESCHDQDAWQGAHRFDHGRTNFMLSGKHRDVPCDRCHTRANQGARRILQFSGVSGATCRSCHRDPHDGGMGQDCRTCHSETGWNQLGRLPEDRFDHVRTGFTLQGRHAELPCQSCHGRPARRDDRIHMTFAEGSAGSTYPAPLVRDCLSCHVDYHEKAFLDLPGGTSCDRCHHQGSWLPTTFDLGRHNSETTFALTGAHQAVPCSSCHGHPSEGSNDRIFHLEHGQCLACHQSDSPHGDQFESPAPGTPCESCHTTDAWRLPSAFDHDRTGFSLTGRHQTAPCAACHSGETSTTPPADVQYRGLASSCEACHAAKSPHRTQFDGRPCQECHDTVAFVLATFDHRVYPLIGGHAGLSCASCHRTEEDDEGAFVRYKPVPTGCRDCHD